MVASNMHKILNDLKWQIEAGIDEVISETPMRFYEDNIIKENKKTENTSPANLDQLMNLNDLYEYLSSSIECELQNISKNSIKIQGNLNSKIMIITNIPSPEEDKEGKVLIGKNYNLFINILSSINLSLDSLCFTPIIPWKTPGERELNENEIELLLPFIKKQIEIIKPRILIFLGADPIKYILQKDTGILNSRGSFLDYTYGDSTISCLPILTPDFLIRRPEYKRETWNDLIILSKKIKELNLQ
jgi:DNA polymerase